MRHTKNFNILLTPLFLLSIVLCKLEVRWQIPNSFYMILMKCVLLYPNVTYTLFGKPKKHTPFCCSMILFLAKEVFRNCTGTVHSISYNGFIKEECSISLELSRHMIMVSRHMIMLHLILRSCFFLGCSNSCHLLQRLTCYDQCMVY